MKKRNAILFILLGFALGYLANYSGILPGFNIVSVYNKGYEEGLRCKSTYR